MARRKIHSDDFTGTPTPIAAVVPLSLRQAVEKCADLQDRSMSSIVRVALAAYVKEHLDA